MFLDMQIMTNSVYPDQTETETDQDLHCLPLCLEQSDQGLHCLPLCLHLLDVLLYRKTALFKYKDN